MASDGAAACDRGWVAVSDASSVSGSGPAGSVAAVRWEPDSGPELGRESERESERARPSAAELRSGQILEHVMPTAIQRPPAPTTLPASMGSPR